MNQYMIMDTSNLKNLSQLEGLQETGILEQPTILKSSEKSNLSVLRFDQVTKLTTHFLLKRFPFANRFRKKSLQRAMYWQCAAHRIYDTLPINEVAD